jgi:hypothetical protein
VPCHVLFYFVHLFLNFLSLLHSHLHFIFLYLSLSPSLSIYNSPPISPYLCSIHRDIPGATSRLDCFGCPSKFYCPLGSVEYTACPAKYFCPANSMNATLCTPGGFCPPDSASPVTCPPGYYCPGGTLKPISCYRGEHLIVSHLILCILIFIEILVYFEQSKFHGYSSPPSLPPPLPTSLLFSLSRYVLSVRDSEPCALSPGVPWVDSWERHTLNAAVPLHR